LGGLDLLGWFVIGVGFLDLMLGFLAYSVMFMVVLRA